MARDDWHRHKTWSAENEVEFRERLRRARDKAQPLRIQASYLTDSNPNVSLSLLEEYFSLGEHFDWAQAYVDRANALIIIGDLDGAYESLEKALSRERAAPKLLTQAYLDFPCLVAMSRTERLYKRALDVLDSHQDRPMFPVDRYRANGARALLLSGLGRDDDARTAARAAVIAAGEERSGFQYHQNVGVVNGAEDDFARRVAAIAG